MHKIGELHSHLDLDGVAQSIPVQYWLQADVVCWDLHTTIIPHQTVSENGEPPKSKSIASEHGFSFLRLPQHWGVSPFSTKPSFESALYHLVSLAFLHLPRLVGA